MAQHGPSTRKCKDNSEKGKLTLFKLRASNGDPSMQVDNAEDERKPYEVSANITLAETEQALRKEGVQYAKENHVKVLEEKFSNQAKMENPTARYDKLAQLVAGQHDQMS